MDNKIIIVIPVIVVLFAFYLGYDLGSSIETDNCCAALYHETESDPEEKNVFRYGERRWSNFGKYDGLHCPNSINSDRGN